MDRMIQIDNNIFVYNANYNALCTEYKKTNLIRNGGWFAKTKGILKLLIQRPVVETNNDSIIMNHISPTARCFECYELVRYDEIGFSRIISNYNRSCNNTSTSNNKIQVSDLQGFEKYYKLSVICTRCVSRKTEFKNAPRNYGDIVADLLINDKLHVLADDLRTIGSNKLEEIDNAIVNGLFNCNEKQIMLNHINKENECLRRNLDMEIEKHKVLSEYKSKNRELQESLKNTLIQSSFDLFRSHKQIIDEQIAKYSEYNNSSRYTIPECRICMQNEVSTSLECGHLLCTVCHNKIQADKHTRTEANNGDNEDDDEPLQVAGYPCPFCKTFCSKFIRIYL